VLQELVLAAPEFDGRPPTPFNEPAFSFSVGLSGTWVRVLGVRPRKTSFLAPKQRSRYTHSLVADTLRRLADNSTRIGDETS
jgi:hypothetical protein